MLSPWVNLVSTKEIIKYYKCNCTKTSDNDTDTKKLLKDSTEFELMRDNEINVAAGL